MSRGETEPWPLPTSGGPWRGGPPTGSATRGRPSTRPAIQDSGRSSSPRAGTIAPAAPQPSAVAPEVVDDDVELAAGGSREPDLVAGSPPSSTSSSAPSAAQQASFRGRWSDRRRHVRGAEVLRDLHRHPAGVAGRAQDEHPLTRLGARSVDAARSTTTSRGSSPRPPATGSTPSGSSMLRRRSTHGLLGHRADGGVRQDEVAEGAVRGAADAVDAGDQRQLVRARVVRPVRPATGLAGGGRRRATSTRTSSGPDGAGVANSSKEGALSNDDTTAARTDLLLADQGSEIRTTNQSSW